MKNIECRLCSIFHVFNYGKWIGLDSDLAYATRYFETLSEIYRCPLYMKEFSGYKWKIKVFHFHVFRFPLRS